MPPADLPPDDWPTRGWRPALPHELGVDAEGLARVCDRILERRLPVHSLLVARHGRLAADIYFHPFAPDSLHDLASCTKSVTSTLVGIAIDKGYIENVAQPVLDLLPGRAVANLDDRKHALTLEHLLTMSTGMACYADPGEPTLTEMMQSDDWAQFVLDLPMIDPPGTRWEYCSPASYLLAVILQEVTGEPLLDFARPHLFDPLGITHPIWPLGPQGVTIGWGGLHLKPHDMAKLGHLFLNEGRWDGRQIVSADWVHAATQRHAVPPDAYGYQWWLYSPDVYFASGRGGQRVVVLPRADAVVVVTAGLRDVAAIDDILVSTVIPAISGAAPLSADRDALAHLDAARRAAAAPRNDPQPVPRLPAMARRVSGLTYRLDPNPQGLDTFTLHLESTHEARISLAGRHGDLDLTIGLDNVPRMSLGRFGLPGALRGSWISDNVFTFEWNELANINTWRVEIAFANDAAYLRMEETTGLGDSTIHAQAQP